MTRARYRIAFLLPLLLSAVLSYSQGVELPMHFGQFFNNPQINLAQGGADGLFEFDLGTRQNTGVFSGVSTSYASAFLRLGDRGESFHVIGGQFERDAEGDLLRRNRFTASYSRHLKVSEDNTLAIGVGLGSYQFVINPNPVSGGAADGTFNSYAGLHFYSDKGYVGLALRQINGGEVQPLDQVLLVQPRYDLLAQRRFDISKGISISPTAFISYSEELERQGGLGAGLGLLFLLSEHLQFGSSYEADQGGYAFLGILDIAMSKQESSSDGRLDIGLSYFLPRLGNARSNINAFEITLGYHIGSREVTSSN